MAFMKSLTGVAGMITTTARPDGLNPAQPVGGLSVFSQDARPIGRDEYKRLTKEETEKAHLYVLNRCHELNPYLEKYLEELQKGSSESLSNMQLKQFAEWFRKHMESLHHKESPEATNDLFAVACGPESMRSYPGCIVKGVCFWIRRDKGLKVPISGLVVAGERENEVVDLYGFVTDVIELVYKFSNRVVLFKCEWFYTNPKENKIEKDGEFTSINVNMGSKWYVNEPFVLATEAQLVFYLEDHKFRSNWKLVQRVQAIEAENSKGDDHQKEAYKGDEPESQQEGNAKSPSSTTLLLGETGDTIAMIKSLQAELETQRALVLRQKVELESRHALIESQTTELESHRALTRSQKAELESRRALTDHQKSELESQCALTLTQQAELESQRVLTRCQQAELESTRGVMNVQYKLLQDQQVRLRQLEQLVADQGREASLNGNDNGSLCGSSLNTPTVEVAEVLARMSSYKRRIV